MHLPGKHTPVWKEVHSMGPLRTASWQKLGVMVHSKRKEGPGSKRRRGLILDWHAMSLREQGGHSHKDLKKQGRVPSGSPAATVPTPPLQQEGEHLKENSTALPIEVCRFYQAEETGAFPKVT